MSYQPHNVTWVAVTCSMIIPSASTSILQYFPFLYVIYLLYAAFQVVIFSVWFAGHGSLPTKELQ